MLLRSVPLLALYIFFVFPYEYYIPRKCSRNGEKYICCSGKVHFLFSTGTDITLNDREKLMGWIYNKKKKSRLELLEGHLFFKNIISKRHMPFTFYA